MTQTIDVRGKPCPEPVIRTRAALAGAPGAGVEVLVDSKESRENVRRLAEGLGYKVEWTEEGGAFRIVVSPGEAQEATDTPPATSEQAPGAATVFIPGATFGTGPEKLGDVLMRAALKTLRELSPRPQKIIFMNDGVKWCCEGSLVLENLRELEEFGAEILACGTCLDFLSLKEKLQVGRVSNMFEILSSLQEANPLIRL